MSYNSYKGGVERRRALLLAELVKANELRLGASLPLYDLDQVIGDKEPLVTKEEHATRSKERRGFAHFRKQQLTQANLPPTQAVGWEQERALVVRWAFVDHQIQVAWDDMKGLSPPPAPSRLP
jgi:hypothetical protein